MSNFSLLLLIAGLAVLIQSAPVKDEPLEGAKEILKKMDKALETKDLKDFLAIHDPNFHFKFCNKAGKNVGDLKKILETDPNMSKSVKSKHSIMYRDEFKGVSKVSENTYKFGYDEHLYLKNNAVFRTKGSINFVKNGPSVKIISAIEDCPKEVTL